MKYEIIVGHFQNIHLKLTLFILRSIFLLILKSFRFGPEIAYVASCVLDVLKGIRNKTLVGGAKRGEYSCTGLTFVSFEV